VAAGNLIPDTELTVNAGQNLVNLVLCLEIGLDAANCSTPPTAFLYPIPSGSPPMSIYP
jgi:hypothetical protein